MYSKYIIVPTLSEASSQIYNKLNEALLNGRMRCVSLIQHDPHCVAAGGLSLDSLDLTEPPRKDHMSLSRDSGLTLSDCQLFISESPVSSDESALVNSSASSVSYDKSVSKDDKTTSSGNKSYVRVYTGWEERSNVYMTGSPSRAAAAELGFREEKNGCPNPNFQRQDWLRAHLKRTPRTKLEENEQQRKGGFDDKDVYDRDYPRRDSIKENLENCKNATTLYRRSPLEKSRGQRVYGDFLERNILDIAERVKTSKDEDAILELKKVDHFAGFKKLKSEQYLRTSRSEPLKKKIVSASSTSDLYEFKKVQSEFHGKDKDENKRYSYEKQSECSGIYGNREDDTEIYRATRERSEIYTFQKREAVYSAKGEERDETRENGGDSSEWPVDPPPPLPPRLRHLPPVHMNLEDRHKIAGRSRSLPPVPPPPYRPPPQPRVPVIARHIQRYKCRSQFIDDESYV